MKKLIIIIFLIPLCLNAQIELAEDYSFKQDKQLHIIAGSGISAGVFILVNNKTNDVDLAFRAAWMSGAFVGMSKEWFDIIRGKEASLSDLSYTILGSLTTAFIMKGITKHRNKKRAKRDMILKAALDIN